MDAYEPYASSFLLKKVGSPFHVQTVEEPFALEDAMTVNVDGSGTVTISTGDFVAIGAATCLEVQALIGGTIEGGRLHWWNNDGVGVEDQTANAALGLIADDGTRAVYAAPLGAGLRAAFPSSEDL